MPIVVDKNNVIVCGHTRYKAAQSLGLKSVPCIVADDLTDEQIKAFRLADNKVSEIAEWDSDKLDKELEDLALADIDMSAFSFDISEMDIDFPIGTIDEQGDLSQKEEKTTTCPNCGEVIVV